MDNVQKHYICTNVPSSQTSRPLMYRLFILDIVQNLNAHENLV
jgi:hypothetical protein